MSETDDKQGDELPVVAWRWYEGTGEYFASASKAEAESQWSLYASEPREPIEPLTTLSDAQAAIAKREAQLAELERQVRYLIGLTCKFVPMAEIDAADIEWATARIREHIAANGGEAQGALAQSADSESGGAR